jgi:hypothetical protein
VTSVADYVLFRSLPFREPQRVMTILERNDSGMTRSPSARTVAAWQVDRRMQHAFSRVSFARMDAALFRIDGVSQRHYVAYVDSAFFPTVGTTPRLDALIAMKASSQCQNPLGV